MTFPVLTFQSFLLQARSCSVLLHEQSPGKGKPESLQVQDQTPQKPDTGTAFPSSFTYTVKSLQPTPSGVGAHISFYGINHLEINYLGKDNSRS